MEPIRCTVRNRIRGILPEREAGRQICCLTLAASAAVCEAYGPSLYRDAVVSRILTHLTEPRSRSSSKGDHMAFHYVMSTAVHTSLDSLRTCTDEINPVLREPCNNTLYPLFGCQLSQRLSQNGHAHAVSNQQSHSVWNSGDDFSCVRPPSTSTTLTHGILPRHDHNVILCIVPTLPWTLPATIAAHSTTKATPMVFGTC